MKFIYPIFLMIFFSCGPLSNRVDGPTTVGIDQAVSGEDFSYRGQIRIYNAESGLVGCGATEIAFNQKLYRVGSQSSSEFLDATNELFNGNSTIQPISIDNCYKYYNLSFSGQISQEPVFQNGTQVVKDVIHVEKYSFK